MPGRKVWEERQEAHTQFLLAGGLRVHGHAAVAGCWKGRLGRRQERKEALRLPRPAGGQDGLWTETLDMHVW